MKKSEAIEKLNAFIDIHGAPGDEVIDFLVNELGMLPPTVVYYATGEYGAVADVIEAANMDCTPEWEPETESYSNEEVLQREETALKHKDQLPHIKLTAEELIEQGVCPCGSESNVGCSVTGCPLYQETEEKDGDK